MTRDEAIRVEIEEVYGIFDRQHPRYGDCRTTAGRHIDRYVRLGMLKLDEPKSAEERAIDVISQNPYSTARGLVNRLNAAGFKIVEKDAGLPTADDVRGILS